MEEYKEMYQINLAALFDYISLLYERYPNNIILKPAAQELKFVIWAKIGEISIQDIKEDPNGDCIKDLTISMDKIIACIYQNKCPTWQE